MVGGAIPTALIVIGFWMAGALQDLLDGFVLINAEYTVQAGLVEYLREDGVEPLFNALGWSLWLVLAGLAAAVVAAC